MTTVKYTTTSGKTRKTDFNSVMEAENYVQKLIKDPNISEAVISEYNMSIKDTEPDWENECEVCNAVPIVPITGMCGPCTFGEADTIGGNW